MMTVDELFDVPTAAPISGVKSADERGMAWVSSASTKSIEAAPAAGQVFHGVTWEKRKYDNTNWENVKLTNMEFKDVSWDGAALKNVEFVGCQFNKTSFFKAQLQEVHFSQCEFTDSRFSESNTKALHLKECQITSSDFVKTVFLKADIAESTFDNCRLMEAVSQGGEWSDITWKKSSFRGFRIERGMWFDAHFEEFCVLAGIRFDDVVLANPIFEKEATLDEACFYNCRLIGPKLDGVSARGASFERTRFINASLGDVNFTRANLHQACLENANLHRANLTEADMSDGQMVGAQLQSAVLVKTKLRDTIAKQASFERARIVEVDASKTFLQFADFSHAEIQGGKWFEANLHGAKNQNGLVQPGQYGVGPIYTDLQVYASEMFDPRV